MVAFAARAMGDQALAVGCPGLAVQYYTAGLGRASARRPACDGRARFPPPGPSLLEVTAGDLWRALAEVRGP
jgi:hypothetical protein